MSFGKSKSKTKTTSDYTATDNTDTTTTYDKTSTPTNPEWVSNGASGLWSAASDLGKVDPQTYVAGPTQLQTMAGQNAGALTGSPDMFSLAEGITKNAFGRPAAQSSGVTADGYVGNYLNPYLDNVVNSSMADFDASAGKTQAQQSLALAKSGAFGGSGSAITQALTQGELARARATTDSGLRAKAYDAALSGAQGDAGRQQGANDLNAQLKQGNRQMILGAAAQLGSLASQNDANQRQNIATQSAVGDAQRQIAQQQATAPLDLQAWLGQYLSGLPTDLFHGSTEGGTQQEVGKEDQAGHQTGTGKTTGMNFGFKLQK